MKKRFRIALDIVMAALMPVLMAYSLVGEALHEIVGSAIFILFIVHQVLNRKWYGAAFKGKYTPRRIFQTVLNAALFVFMILQPVSGILLSKHLYTFIPVPLKIFSMDWTACLLPTKTLNSPSMVEVRVPTISLSVSCIPSSRMKDWAMAP